MNCMGKWDMWDKETEQQRLRKASVTRSPVPQSCFPMVHNSLLPDLIDTPENASELHHTCAHTHRQARSHTSQISSCKVLFYSRQIALDSFPGFHQCAHVSYCDSPNINFLQYVTPVIALTVCKILVFFLIQ